MTAPWKRNFGSAPTPEDTGRGEFIHVEEAERTSNRKRTPPPRSRARAAFSGCLSSRERLPPRAPFATLRDAVKTNFSALAFASCSWLLAACGGATGTTTTETQVDAKDSGREESAKASAPPAPSNDPEAAAALASPVSGPALDDLPPPPPTRVEQEPVDLTTLSEPPRLVVDGHGHTGRVSALSYTHDGRSLVTASYDKTVRVWSAQTGELERTIRGERGEGAAGRIVTAALSPDDQFLALGGWLGTSATPSHGSNDPAFAIRIVDFRSEAVYRLLQGHSDVVLSTAFSRDGKRLLSGAGDRSARIWDVMGGRSQRTLYGHSEGVTSVAWSPDDKLVATGSSDDTARVWDGATGTQLATLTGHTDDIRSLTFTPSGRSIITGSLDGTVRIWEAASGRHLKTLAEVGAPIGSVSISSGGLEVLVTTVGAPYANHVYNINNGRRVAVFTGHDNGVLASAISPNGKWAATAGGGDFSVSVWDLKTGTRHIHSSGHGQTIWNVGFSKDGEAIAWSSDYDSKHTGQYQLNGPLRHKLRISSGTSDGLAVRPLTNQTDFVRAITRVGDVDVRTSTGREHEDLEISAGARRRATIRRDLTTGFVHRAFGLTPDGRTVVSGGDNGVLSSFDSETGRKLADFEGHTGDVLALAISPDGKLVVTGSTDQTVRLWHVGTGALLMTMFHARNGEWVAFTPAGYYASSPFGDAYVGWHANRGPDQPASYFPTSALSAQLRFDLVVRKYVELGGSIEQAITACNEMRGSGLPKINYYRFEDLPQFAPPDVYYLDPGDDLRIESDRLKVTARAHSPSAEPITAIDFLVNGRPMDERWLRHVGRPRESLSGREAEISATLPLPNKSNKISVVARNRFNESVPVSFEVERTGGAKELEKLYQPELYMLSVGISDYGSPHLTPLSYAHKDAEEVGALLLKKNTGLYKHVEIRTLTENAASRSAIMNGLGWLAGRASQKDVAIVFLSGYAARGGDGEYYFIPHDADIKRLEETAVLWKDLKARIEGLPAKVVLMVDSSHAGAWTEKTDGAPLDMAQLLRSTISHNSGIVVMTSSTGAESSYESPQWKHGAFTKALLDGIGGGADYDGDKHVFIRELEHYVKKRVVALTGGKQHPTTDIPEELPNFPLSQR